MKSIEFPDATDIGAEVYTANELLLQKMRLSTGWDKVQEYPICKIIDTTTANRCLKKH
jgi:hypothetical protein